MSKLLTEDQVVKLIRKGQGTKKIDEYAKELGISGVWLRNLYSDDPKQRTSPGPKVLEKFNLKRVFRYEADDDQVHS